MATSINFPDSPSVGQEYTYGSVTYKWDGLKWNVLGTTVASQITFENLDDNGDVGVGSAQVALGNDTRFTDNRTPTDGTVTPNKLDDEFKTIVALGAGVNLDWSVGQTFTKILSTAPTYTFSNLHVGVKFIETTGDYSPTFPSGFTYVGGERAATGTTLYQIVCTNASTPIGYYSILKDES